MIAAVLVAGCRGGNRNRPPGAALSATILATIAAAVLAAGCGEDRGAAARDAQARTSAGPVVETLTPDPDSVADAASTASPRGRRPVLTVGGHTDPNVYLQSLDINVDVTGNIASTRYTMTFRNRTDRILEGELTFPLPDGVAATYYALDINGKMRDAVPVEKARATQVFEEIQRREVDPGLLERVEGGSFRTRVYPFPRYGTRTISIGYEEELTLENGLLKYRLPMAYVNPIERFSVKATVWNSAQKPVVAGFQDEDEVRFDKAGEKYVAEFARENYLPARALDFSLPAPANIPRVMAQRTPDGYYFLASVIPEPETRRKLWPDDIAVVWDVSLSGSQRDLKREMEALEIIFADRKNANAHLYFLNNRFKKIAAEDTSGGGAFRIVDGDWSELKRVLETAAFDGGTDYSQIRLNDIAGSEILFFTDGLSTLSDVNFLNDKGANRRVNRPVRPIHCIVSSSKADYSAMRLIAGRTGGKFVNMNALSSGQLTDELLNETLQFFGVEHGGGIREVYPGVAAPVRGDFSVAGIFSGGDAELTMLFGFGGKVERRVRVRLDARNAARGADISRIWAQKKIAELDLDHERNRAELTALGMRFGVVTRNTSLLVLELASDYDTYKIEPPASEPELLKAYRDRMRERRAHIRNTERDRLRRVLVAAKDLGTWLGHKITFEIPVDEEERRAAIEWAKQRRIWLEERHELERVRAERREKRRLKDDIFTDTSKRKDFYLIGPPGQPRGSQTAVAQTDDPGYSRQAYQEPRPPEEVVKIKVTPVRKDRSYLNGLTGNVGEDYRAYLKLRDGYSNSPDFYFDMAEWFYRHDDREAALRVLTSIAELELENASLYRLLGYRFKEYGEYALQKFVCKKVIEWRPLEPQSYRDYALALADNGEHQAALDSLSALLARTYSADTDRRSAGIEEVVITEINRLIAKHPRLNTSRVDRRLLMKVSTDVRVVINWNMNGTDVNLRVAAPSGEEWYSSHGHHKTADTDWRVSSNNRDGYGPEQFLLKRAVKGTYKIYVNRVSVREFTPEGPATVMAEIYTNYAGKNERREVAVLQLSNARRYNVDKVEVAEFEF